MLSTLSRTFLTDDCPKQARIPWTYSSYTQRSSVEFRFSKTAGVSPSWTVKRTQATGQEKDYKDKPGAKRNPSVYGRYDETSRYHNPQLLINLGSESKKW
jgi:hypothetical protein